MTTRADLDAEIDKITKARHDVVVKEAVSVQPRNTLDVGCRGGHLTSRLPKPVVGLDVDAEVVRLAREACEKAPSVTFETGDFLHPRPVHDDDRIWDLLTMCEVLEHHDEETAFRMLRKALRIARTVIVQVPAPGRSKQVDGSHIMDFGDFWFVEAVRKISLEPWTMPNAGKPEWLLRQFPTDPYYRTIIIRDER